MSKYAQQFQLVKRTTQRLVKAGLVSKTGKDRWDAHAWMIGQLQKLAEVPSDAEFAAYIKRCRVAKATKAAATLAAHEAECDGPGEYPDFAGNFDRDYGHAGEDE